MHMIVNATDPDHGAIQAYGDRAKVAVHRGSQDQVTKKGAPVLGRENDVHENIR
jgi:hypothetical protein